MHAERGLQNPLDTWELTMVKKGIHRRLGKPPKQKLPITPHILNMLYNQLDLQVNQHKAFWAACLVAFFSFLRKSTLLPKSPAEKDIYKALCMGDLHINGDELMTLRIRHTKTIQFGQRELCLPISSVPGSPLCPLSAVAAMLAALPAQMSMKISQPLFSYVSAGGTLQILTHSTFVKLLKYYLKVAGVNPSEYSGHSFRRGGCTHAFKLGISPLLIKLRGDWKSNAFERYININTNHHIMFAKTLSQSVLSF